MTTWVKLIGSADWPVSSTPIPDDPTLLASCRFPKGELPRVGKGDRLIYYAVGGFKSVFAIVDVVGDPVANVPHWNGEIFKRWPHAVAVSATPMRVDDLAYAPALEAIGKRLPGEIHQGVSHFPISEAQEATAEALLRQGRERERMDGRASARRV